MSVFNSEISTERPAGIKAIAVAFFLSAAYLAILGVVMLVRPGTFSMALGAPLLFGLELAGPFMFLLIAASAALVGFGLTRLNRWARRAAILAALAGLVMLLPDVSAAVVEFNLKKLAEGGLGIILRVMIVWYLYQEPVTQSFSS